MAVLAFLVIYPSALPCKMVFARGFFGLTICPTPSDLPPLNDLQQRVILPNVLCISPVYLHVVVVKILLKATNFYLFIHPHVHQLMVPDWQLYEECGRSDVDRPQVRGSIPEGTANGRRELYRIRAVQYGSVG